jgi:hypothetical protein
VPDDTMEVVVTPEDHNAPILPRDVQSGMALARAAGHSWNDINDHLKVQQQIALDRDFRRRGRHSPRVDLLAVTTVPLAQSLRLFTFAMVGRLRGRRDLVPRQRR